MEELPSAPTELNNTANVDAAPLSAALHESKEIETPLNDSLPSPSAKSPLGSIKDTDKADVGSNASIEKIESNNNTEKSTSVAKSPVPVLSSTATGDVDYASWDFEPPLANIRRLLKPILSKGTNISKGMSL